MSRWTRKIRNERQIKYFWSLQNNFPWMTFQKSYEHVEWLMDESDSIIMH